VATLGQTDGWMDRQRIVKPLLGWRTLYYQNSNNDNSNLDYVYSVVVIAKQIVCWL